MVENSLWQQQCFRKDRRGDEFSTLNAFFFSATGKFGEILHVCSLSPKVSGSAITQRLKMTGTTSRRRRRRRDMYKDRITIF